MERSFFTSSFRTSWQHKLSFWSTQIRRNAREHHTVRGLTGHWLSSVTIKLGLKIIDQLNDLNYFILFPGLWHSNLKTFKSGLEVTSFIFFCISLVPIPSPYPLFGVMCRNPLIHMSATLPLYPSPIVAKKDSSPSLFLSMMNSSMKFI